MQTTTSQVYLHKLRAADVESLISERQQYLRHSGWPVTKALIGTDVTLGMFEAFVNELDAVGWDPKPCRWLG